MTNEATTKRPPLFRGGGRSTLELEDVREIRVRYALGDAPRDIAKAFPQVGTGTVRQVCSGATFRKVELDGFKAELFVRRLERATTEAAPD